MTGQMPRTTSGTPSYTLAKAVITKEADELLYAKMTEYGLTNAEMACIVIGIGRCFAGDAVRDQQKRSASRKGVIGTP